MWQPHWALQLASVDIQLAPAESTGDADSNAAAKLQVQLKSVKHADLQQLTLKVSLLSMVFWQKKTCEHLGCWQNGYAACASRTHYKAQESLKSSTTRSSSHWM